MILLPLWPKETLRFPTMSAALLTANILIFLVTWPMQVRQNKNVGQDDLQRMVQKLTAIALDGDSSLKDSEKEILRAEYSVEPVPSPQLLTLLKQIQENPYALSSKSRYEWDLVYPVFDSYARSTKIAPNKITVFKQWGFNPNEDWWPGLLTHEFLHAGITHLLFNLIFLWIAASIVEECAGAHILWIYIVGGMAAAIAQVQVGVPMGSCLVGASGSISALLGFSLAARPHAKVKLLYILIVSLVPRYGVFDSPLWFFLPIWFVTQILESLLVIDKSTMSTAFAAHIGGFIFGCIIGMVWRLFEKQRN